MALTKPVAADKAGKLSLKEKTLVFNINDLQAPFKANQWYFGNKKLPVISVLLQ